MKQKRILLIADSDALWTQRYIEYVLLPEKYEIVLFPIWGNEGKFEAFYRENNVRVVRDEHTLPVIRRVPRLRLWTRVALNARDLEALGPFDIVHNHYLSQRDLALGWKLVKRFHARWICSFWGSDLLRSPKKELRRMKPYLHRCDGITVHSELNRKRIRELYGDEYAKKTTLLYFGQIGYQNIDLVGGEMDQAACKAHFGVPAERYVVCPGYSASPAQHQLEVVRALAGLPEERLGRVALILQQTYQKNSPEYMEEVQKAARALPCQTVVLTEFMDDMESARLRLATDLFIHAIATDAFSGSLQEYLYAGATVIKGDWLDYPQLEEMGIRLPSFHEYQELPALVARAMEGELPPLTQERRALFPQRYSWAAARGAWLKLYP